MYLEIGQCMTFQRNPGKRFLIREILNKPNVTMDWVWDRGVCPHCNEKIKEEVVHLLERVEVATDLNKEDKDLKISDIKVTAYTKDNRYMLVNNETKKKVLELCSIPKIKDLSKEL